MIDDTEQPHRSTPGQDLGPSSSDADARRATGEADLTAIIVADPSPLVRDGVAAVIRGAPEALLSEAARDADELRSLAAARRPRAIIVAVDLLEEDGVLGALRETAAAAPLIVLVDRLPEPRVTELYAAGVHAVLPKDGTREDLLATVRAVLRGQTVVPPAVQRALEDEPARLAAAPSVTASRRRTARPAPRGPEHVAGDGPGRPAAPAESDLAPAVAATAVSLFRVAWVAVCGLLWITGALPVDTPPLAAAVLVAGGAAATIALLRVRMGAPPQPILALTVDIVLVAALGAAAGSTLAGTVLLAAVLCVHALRVDPVRLAAACGLAVVASGVAAVTASHPPSAGTAAVALALLGLAGAGAVLIAGFRVRADQEQTDLVLLRGELLRESLAAERRGRRRLAEELHDDPLQLLLVARQDLEEAAESPELIDGVRGTLEVATLRFRELMYDASRDADAGQSLREVLCGLCANRAARGRFTWSVTVSPGADGVDDELVAALAQELLTNVVKHARATRVAVSVRRRRAVLLVDVVDDGIGLSEARRTQAAAAGHLGLTSLHRRVRAAGGRWEVEPGEQGGTAVRVVLPAPVRPELPL